MSSKFIRLCVSSSVLLCGRMPLHAQAVYGNVAGVVTDVSGLAIAGAKITVSDLDRGIAYETATSSTGEYAQRHLLAGHYRIQVVVTGFATAASLVDVHVDTTVQASLQLTVASDATQVTVIDDTPLLQTDRSEVSTSLSTQQVEELPTLDRNLTALLLTTPGTQLTSFQHSAAANPQAGLQVASNGQQFSGNGFVLDGTENQSAILGIAVINPNIDATQELKITTSNYDAEFGSVAGALLQATTKSGTNQFHGSAFEYLRNDVFNAQNPFSPGRLGLHWNQFGGAVGGPVFRNKLFFFADYQGTRRNTGAPVTTTVPTSAERAGDLSGLLGDPIPNAFVSTTEGAFVQARAGMIFDPATGDADGTGRQAVSHNGQLNVFATVPKPIANLLNYLPLPNTGPAGSIANNYTGSGKQHFSDDQEDGRVDYAISDKSRFFGRYTISNFSIAAPGAFGDVAGGPALAGTNFAGSSLARNQSLSLGYFYTLSPTLVTEARFGSYRYHVQTEAGGLDTTPASDAGIPGLNLGTTETSGMPAFYVNGDSGFNLGYSLGINDCNCPLRETENHFQWVNNWTKTWRAHTIRWGIDVRRAQQTLQASDSHRSGELSFNQSTTGDADADVAGAASGLTTGSGLGSLFFGVPGFFGRYYTGSAFHPGLRQTRLFLFAQDDWRVTPKLTLNYGFRYENYRPQTAASPGGAGAFDPATGEVLEAGVGTVSSSMGVHAFNIGLVPRIGFAYQVLPHTVVRAGYGSSFTPSGLGAVFGQAADYDPPVLLPQQINAANPYSAAYDLFTGPSLPTIPTSSTGRFPLPNGISVFYTFDLPNGYRIPSVDFWNLALQEELSPTMSVSATYVGNVGRHIFVSPNLNQATPGPGDYDQRRRFYQKFGLEQGIYSTCNCANSNYHSLQLTWQKHAAHGLEFLAAYTYSKALDTSELGGVASNNLDFAADYGPASFDRTHALQVSNVWTLPFGRGQRFGSNASRLVDLVGGGWQLNGISTFSSGLPFTPVVANAPLLNTDFNSVRPDQVGDPSLSHPNRALWFNPAAYVAPQEAYRNGNVRRNSLRGPKEIMVNLALAKSFNLGEARTLEFRWENFNALNHTNLNLPNSYVDTAGAGTITSIQTDVRQMQFGLHFRM